MQHFATLLRQPSHGTTRRRQGCSDWDILPFLMAARSSGPHKRLYLIDAMSYIFRAYHAPTPQRFASPTGVPTQAVFLFTNMLRKLLREHAPDYVAVVFESKGPTVRDQLFKEYKAQRPPTPDDLKAQIPYIFRLCQGMRLAVLQHEGYEADDVIGTLACRAAAAGLEVVIVTSDKDMLQLVRTQEAPPVRVFSHTKEKFFDEAEVENYFGVPPEKVVDLVALMGDAIDNIPGAKGIGEKGARELITAYGSVEAAMAHAAEVKKKNYREALQTQQEQIRLSKQLAQLHTDLPMPLELDRLGRPQPRPPPAARARPAGAPRAGLARARRAFCRARLHFPAQGAPAGNYGAARGRPLPRAASARGAPAVPGRAARGSARLLGRSRRRAAARLDPHRPGLLAPGRRSGDDGARRRPRRLARRRPRLSRRCEKSQGRARREGGAASAGGGGHRIARRRPRHRALLLPAPAHHGEARSGRRSRAAPGVAAFGVGGGEGRLRRAAGGGVASGRGDPGARRRLRNHRAALERGAGGDGARRGAARPAGAGRDVNGLRRRNRPAHGVHLRAGWP